MNASPAMTPKAGGSLRSAAWCLALLSMAGLAGADDAARARRLLESGRILPLQTIIERVREHHPGRILEVGLEIEDGRTVYEVELIDPNGKVRELYIDAATGRLLTDDPSAGRRKDEGS